MTFLWTSLFTLLCGEIGLIALLLLSCIPTHIWCKVISSVSWIYHWVDRILGITWYFWALVTFLTLIFMRSLHDMWKYEDAREGHKVIMVDSLTKQQDKVNLFRAQRNVYISGLTLFLALVIRRLVSLIITLGRTREQRNALGYKKKN